MSSFKKQIEEDIRDYQEKYPNITEMKKDAWAFNFWVLDKLFSEDESVIESEIVDYNDKGIDCYVWHEDTHDLYLIQNKYFGENTKLGTDYVLDDFLVRPIGALEQENYKRSKELQQIYSKNKDLDDFQIYYHLYVTNDICKTDSLEKEIQKFNNKKPNQTAYIFSLSDIENAYYDKPIINKKPMSFDLKTINKGTTLTVNNEAYKMDQALDAKYVLVPVFNLYELCNEAKKINYPLFEENIREYLGATRGVNKGIVNTLKDPEDRKNFFYYNNGITIIADDIGKIVPKGDYSKIQIDNPQIVNGCQTVSTITETLSSLPEASLEKDFEDTFVMVKVLKISTDDDKAKELYENIVKYNNSQNKIDQKAFEANKELFKTVQKDFLDKGLLLCIKQSDKNQFTQKYKASDMIKNNSELFSRYDLNDYIRLKDFFVDLEKFLQVLLAFSDSTKSAIQGKSHLLDTNKSENQIVMDFIRDNDATTNTLINLYMLYLKAEKAKNNSEDSRTPNPFYLVHCFSHYECSGDKSKIVDKLKTKEEIDRIMKLYTFAYVMYKNTWMKKHEGKAYNEMIKSDFDYEIMDTVVESAKAAF